jgi:hypothetical protein
MFTIDPATARRLTMKDDKKFPRTAHIDDADIIDAIYRREMDGHSVTRGHSLAAALHDRIDEHPPSRATERELDRRMLKLSRERKLQLGEDGDYSLVEPLPGSLYTLRLRGEDPEEFYRLQGKDIYNADELAKLLGNLTGFRWEYILLTRLAHVQPGESATYGSIGPVKFIVTRRS